MACKKAKRTEQVVMTDQQEWKVSRNMKRELKQRMMNDNGL